MKAGLDAISNKVGEHGSFYVKSNKEVDELYEIALRAVRSKFEDLRRDRGVQVNDLNLEH